MTGNASKHLFTAHGGRMDHYCELTGRSAEDILDFSVNVNPDGLPDFLRAAVHRALHTVDAYPHPYAAPAVEAAARFHGLAPEQIVFGNGTSQLIHVLPQALNLSHAVIHIPAFSEYETACRAHGTSCIFAADTTPDGLPDINELARNAPAKSAIFIATPGNPTARALSSATICEAALSRPDVWFIIDEAFIDYAPVGTSLLANLEESSTQQGIQPPILPDNCIVLRSLTKFYGAAGLRTGYLAASSQAAALIRAALPEWSLNCFAISVTQAMFEEGQTFRQTTHAENTARRAAFSAKLARLPGITVFPSDSNFLFFRAPERTDLFKALLQYGIATRDCRNFRSLEDGTYYRVAVRHEEDNNLLTDVLDRVLAAPLDEETPITPFAEQPSTGRAAHHASLPRSKRCPAVMLQGTSSNAGKSVLTAAFCRILLQDGYRVAPFKAQNMALNSHVTPDGREIGRAQAVQAQACRLLPDPRMNPILLKPNTDTGSQVIVMGKAQGNMNVKEYFAFKENAFSTVKKAYDSLAEEYDVLVLEGAGSPGEVNLKKNDIVNMNMARYAASPVLLTGDIDRGGVYASFLGTVSTFDRWEQDLLAGFLVNRFRGDASLLAPAHAYLHSFTQKPVLGVIPHIDDLGLPEEDSVSMRFGCAAGKDADCLDVALIALPRISNFTDFDPLEYEPDVNVRLVRTAEELGRPDVIIIPGSKSVISDLCTLRERGLDTAIRQQAEAGTWVIGICAGLQILGRTISDPLAIESGTAHSEGLGLIGLTTVLEEHKVLTTVQQAEVVPYAHLPLLWPETEYTDIQEHAARHTGGYEIHHGQTTAENGVAVTLRKKTSEGTADHTTALGYAHQNVWTTYLHGVFDDDAFRRAFIDGLRITKGYSASRTIRAKYDTEKALDRLADVVRRSVDLPRIYERMGL